MTRDELRKWAEESADFGYRYGKAILREMDALDIAVEAMEVSPSLHIQRALDKIEAARDK